MYIWFPYNILEFSKCQYNNSLPKVHTHMISYSFPGALNQRFFKSAEWKIRSMFLLTILYLNYCQFRSAKKSQRQRKGSYADVDVQWANRG